MEINSIIKQTLLSATAFQIVCGLVINGQEGSAVFALELTPENIQKILDIAGKQVWEQLAGSPIRVRLGQDGKNKPTLEAVGHFMADQWITIPNETEVEEDTDIISEPNVEE